MITFDTAPDAYRHWKLTFNGPIATLSMDVREDAGLSDDYKLKLNSYDLGVDIELADAIQRIRFEHPEVRSVIINSLKERIFCAGANIMMLRGSPTATRSTSASSPTRPAWRSRTRARIPGSSSSPRSTASAPAAATSSRWRATRSCWWTTATPRSACRRLRCSGCCPAPAA
jgi:hypothetical protein